MEPKKYEMILIINALFSSHDEITFKALWPSSTSP